MDDALVMYFIVRKDVPLSLAEAMAAAGAAAARCDERFGGEERWHEWRDSSFRKVALRASPEELERVRSDEDCVEAHGILCLPPQRMSERSPLLEALLPFTDAPRPPAEPPPPADDVPAMLYLIRPGVMKTAGKAMAQAGHASLMCLYQWGEIHAERFADWRAADRPGELGTATDEQWERLREADGTVVVRDGGRTQVEPGTETVIAFVPEPRAFRTPI